MSKKNKLLKQNQGDKNFDELAAKFSRKIYGSPKGKIRLHHLWNDFNEFLPNHHNRPLDIIDVGCGVGHFAAKLAQKGHHLTLVDVSSIMLEQSKAYFKEESVDISRVQWVNESWQEFGNKHKKQYDVVLSHAVLEWVADPEAALKMLTSLVKPNGHLSLMFYNRNSLVMRNAIRGNFYKVFDGQFGGDDSSLTPDYPLDPKDVFQWLEQSPFSVLTKTGIRVFYDYLPGDIEKNRSYEDVLKLESLYCKQEPFLSLGRYIHVLLQRK